MSGHYLIRLEDAKGTVLASMEDARGLLDDVLIPASEECHGLLRFVEAYGTTVFNGTQAEAILADIRPENLMAHATDDLNSTVLSEFKGMLHRCVDDVHVFVKIYGD